MSFMYYKEEQRKENNRLENLANSIISPKKKKKRKNLKTQKYWTYKEYIKSGAWRKRRKEYYKTHPKKCAVCQTNRKIGLHHKNYGRLGREKDKDLVALCWIHHEIFHELHGTKNLFENTGDFIALEKSKIEIEELDERFLMLVQ